MQCSFLHLWLFLSFAAQAPPANRREVAARGGMECHEGCYGAPRPSALQPSWQEGEEGIHQFEVMPDSHR